MLRLIVEDNIQQMSSMTLLSRGGWQCAHFKSCTLSGTPHTAVYGSLPTQKYSRREARNLSGSHYICRWWSHISAHHHYRYEMWHFLCDWQM